jgi:phosphopantothenoylcysteine decarboxylase / phosphopantothenate---cysteine ligase
MLSGKKIIVGITASIAAYKSAFLVRLLIKQGGEVQVIMTDSATEFITPLTLSTLSKKPVLIDFVKDKTGSWNNHVELGLWADAFVVAPASANTIAKCANGFCDNLLTATYLSAKCPVFFAPAMDLDMHQHHATQENFRKLQSFHNQIISSEFGELASGLVGEGRMAEPEHIVSFLERYFYGNQRDSIYDNETPNHKILLGKKVLITAGPTYEHLDPVRFIGNYSTGKMGYAIAENLAQKGAEVVLVSGNTNIQLSGNQKNIELIKVVSAQQMYEACREVYSQTDITILTAAVADYRPKQFEANKIKKTDDIFVLEMEKTIDIAATLGKVKKTHQINIGFALETNNEIDNALKKLHSKNFDFIVLNSLQDVGAGFGYDTNKITILDKHGKTQEYSLKSKKEVADDIVEKIVSIIK